MKYEITLNDRMYALDLTDRNGGGFAAILTDSDGRKIDRSIDVIQRGDTLVLLSGNNSFNIDCWIEQEHVSCIYKGERFRVQCKSDRDKLRMDLRGRSEDNERDISVKMPGRVVKILVEPGESVKKGQGVLILEAMKMENKIAAPHDGIIEQIMVSEGANLETGQVLVRFCE